MATKNVRRCFELTFFCFHLHHMTYCHCHASTGPKPVVITLTSSSSREVWTEWRKLNDGSKYYVEVFCNGSKLGTRKLVHESTFKTNAKPGHKYHFQVSAVNKFGQEGPKSQSSIVETGTFSCIGYQTPPDERNCHFYFSLCFRSTTISERHWSLIIQDQYGFFTATQRTTRDKTSTNMLLLVE